MKASTPVRASAKVAPPSKPLKLKTPKAANPFGAFVAEKAKQATKPADKPAETPPTANTFIRHERNGRKEYTPGTIGHRIWATADALQAATPHMPVVAEAVRIALPDVKPASVSAGLSHWRKYRGTMRVKSA